MKANQAFRNEEEAVSPVIGVILMVAITVVLAAVVFVLVQNLSKGGEKAPDMGFTKDNNARTISVVKAPVGNDAIVYVTGLNWGGDCAVDNLNGANPAAAPTSANTVTAGDILHVTCAAGETITLTHVATGTLVYSADWT